MEGLLILVCTAMSVFVKICGMGSEDEAQAVADLGADAVGFIFWSQSRRYIDPAEVGSWSLPQNVLKVGVFVDAEPREVESIVEIAGLDAIQLHGGEDPGDYDRIAAGCWKVLHLDAWEDRFSVDMEVDAYLLDSRTAESPGGTGKVCDWDAAAEFVGSTEKKVVLAGGLNPENVMDALERVKPWGVDVSSGVESAEGRKDLILVQEFIERCRKS